jgi:hypothetical protein
MREVPVRLRQIDPRNEGRHRRRKMLEMIFDKLDNGSEGLAVAAKTNRLLAAGGLELSIDEKDSYPAFSIAGSEMSRRSTISLVTSNSLTRFWLGR